MFLMTKIHLLVVRNLLIFKSVENISYFYPTALLAILALILYQICQHLSISIMFFTNNTKKKENNSFPQTLISMMCAVKRELCLLNPWTQTGYAHI